MMNDGHQEVEDRSCCYWNHRDCDKSSDNVRSFWPIKKLDFPEKTRIPFLNATFWGPQNSCEVAII